MRRSHESTAPDATLSRVSPRPRARDRPPPRHVPVHSDPTPPVSYEPLAVGPVRSTGKGGCSAARSQNIVSHRVRCFPTMTQTLTQYTKSDESAHEHAKRTIATTLVNEARGRENAISSADLAERTPVSASTVRDLIPVVIEEYRLPIGNAQGYFVIEDVGELDRQVNRQVRQAETSMRRAGLISAAWDSGDSA